MSNSTGTAGRAAKFAWRLQYRLGVYFLLFLAGTIGFFAPPPALEEVNNLYIRSTWAGCLILGGLSCMWGLWRLRFRPQILGSILCAAGIGVYAVALTPVLPVSTVVILILLSFVHKLLIRAYQLKVNDDAGVPGAGRWGIRPVLAEADADPDPLSGYSGSGVVGGAVVEGSAVEKLIVDIGPEPVDIILFGGDPPTGRSRGESSGSVGDSLDRGAAERPREGETIRDEADRAAYRRSRDDRPPAQ